MIDPADTEFSEADFTGRARLFPLPNLVMFPHVIQPLHIFEDRYRQMMRDALAGDKLLTMCLLAPGWEKARNENPPIHQGACLGRIASWRELPDGRYNLLLAGLRRVKVVNEVDSCRSYRQAHVEICHDTTQVDDLRQEELRIRLAGAFKRALGHTALGEQSQDLRKLFESPLCLTALTDILAYSLEMDLQTKQQLLEETCVEARAQALLQHLGQAPKCSPEDQRAFPPDFSMN